MMLPLLTHSNVDHVIQCIIDETARSQTDSTEQVFVYTHLINLLGEFVSHTSIDIVCCSFLSTFKPLFDALTECGTTLPLFYLIKCIGNLLQVDIECFSREMFHIGLVTSLVNYLSILIEKSTLGKGRYVLHTLHDNIFQASLSILYNIGTYDQQLLTREIVLERICRPLFRSNEAHVRLVSCLLYCYLLTPNELELDSSCIHLIEQMIDGIRQAFDSNDYHLQHRISLSTLLQCLKQLSMNQSSKDYFAEHVQHMSLFFEILRRCHMSNDNQDEVRYLLETIWFLVFNHRCASIVHQHDRYFALLVQIAEQNPCEQIQRCARGILWQIRSSLMHSTHVHSRQSLSHIMFSYNHHSKDLVHRICQSLRQLNYRIWLDIDDMHGNTLESMAHAVEQASLLVICMTDKYKQSPNCQSEAEYAYRLKKPFVPIVLQSKYKPDGWLGMLVGARVYVDFTKKDFLSNMKLLVNEIEASQQLMT
jgi:hypothetical protein